jgi:hypothetical protein
MLNEGAFTQQQTGGNVPTTNPQSVPAQNLQPQQAGLQGGVSQVLGTSNLLERSSNSTISVNGEAVNNEIGELQASQGSASDSVQSMVAGREVFIIGFIVIVVSVLIYLHAKQISREAKQQAS